MDVTCERCKTGYEFDDALVSERGTSVRCTTCGHTFKVRRPGSLPGAASTGKERWLVRTIDGRELEFRALRELQAAIGKGMVRRDDVLARENGRPRRLGSIAELDPFFSARTLTHASQGTFSKTSIGVGPAARARSHTPAGLGGQDPRVAEATAAALASRDEASAEAHDQSAVRVTGDSQMRFPMLSGTTEGSVAIPLAMAVAKHPSEPPGRRQLDSRPPRTPSPSAVSEEEARASVAIEGSGPPPQEDVTHQVPRAELQAAILEAEALAAKESVDRALASAGALDADATARPARKAEEAEDTTAARPRARTLRERALPDADVKTQPMAGKAPLREQLATTTVDEKPPFEAEVAKQAPPPPAEPPPPVSADGPPSSSASTHNPAVLPPPPPGDAKPAPGRPALPPAPTAPGPVDTPEGGMTPTPTPISPRDTPDDRGSLVDIRPSTASLLTPTPADVRYSYVGDHTRSSEGGRFSAVESRRVGSARWIFAVLLLGAVVVGGAIAVRRWLARDPRGEPTAADGRVVALIAEAERSLAEGDLDAAKEHIDRATGLAERDPRVAALASRIANERAELPWLEVRFLATDDASRPAVKQRLAERVTRAKSASTAAVEVSPREPEAVRERIDALRLAGDLPAARALVPQLSTAASDPRAQLVLAALDLAEESPPFATLVPRLAKAAAEEGGGGRARLLYVYALARSGDVPRAKQELERLRPTHPLRAPAAAFLDRTDKGVPPALDIESLPDAAPSASGALGDAEVPGDFRLALEQASQALSKGDSARADKLYRAALASAPGNPEALAGIGHVARARGQSGVAIEQYKRSLEGSPGYLPALVPLADMMWDSGDRSGAQELYRRIVQLAPGGAAGDRARERLGSGGSPAPTAAPSASAREAPPPSAAPDAPPAPAPSGSSEEGGAR